MKNKKNTVVPDAESLVSLRHSVGWTQEEAAKRAGYSERLIRKLEQGGTVRRSTLNDVLTGYHAALGKSEWNIADFLANKHGSSTTENGLARNRDAEQLVTDYFDAIFNQRRIDRIPEFISEDFKLSAEGRTEVGRQVVEQRVQTLLSAFSPIIHQMVETASQGNKVFCRWSVRKQHVGEFATIPATMKWVEAKGQSTVLVVDNLITEAHDHWEIDHVIRQLRGEDPLVI